MPRLRDHSTVQTRLYRRGTAGRYYADLRDYADVGGAQEALCPPGSRWATSDEAVAITLVTSRLKVLEQRRRDRAAAGAPTRLKAYAARHLRMAAAEGDAEEQWLEATELHLKRACEFFGERTDLGDITVSRCTDYVAHLCALSNGRGGTLSGQSTRHHLNSLSAMFGRAVREGVLPLGGNPIAAVKKPSVDAASTVWLEAPEMQAILCRAASIRPVREDLACPYFFPILATYAYTGAREDEALGLERHDVNLERGIIHLRRNEWRPSLKTAYSERPLTIFPEYAPILRSHLATLEGVPGRLLFPGRGTDGEERMITDLRKMLDKMPMPERLRVRRSPKRMETMEEERLKRLARKLAPSVRGPRPKESMEELSTPTAEWYRPPLRTKILRHSWCAARLQTLDQGRPIAVFTVAREMGHEDTKMVHKIYGHLGQVRCRSNSVEWMRED